MASSHLGSSANSAPSAVFSPTVILPEAEDYVLVTLVSRNPRLPARPALAFRVPGICCRGSQPLHSGVAARFWSPVRPGAWVEILDLRHFSSADLRPLLEDEIKVWANSLCWDYTSSAEMILRYMDAKFLPGYAAVSRGKIFGYSFFVYENSKGVIGDLFVSRGENGAGRHEV